MSTFTSFPGLLYILISSSATCTPNTPQNSSQLFHFIPIFLLWFSSSLYNFASGMRVLLVNDPCVVMYMNKHVYIDDGNVQLVNSELLFLNEYMNENATL